MSQKYDAMTLRAAIAALALSLLALMAGCATGFARVNHGFGFNVYQDDQDALVLDYKYMAGSKLQFGAPEDRIKMGEKFGGTSTFGPMLRGTSLYVKWVNRTTGKVYEDTVDLWRRLPGDIENQKVYFMIYGSQLYVYLVSDERRLPNEPAIGPSVTNYRRTIQIYPDQPKR